MTRMVHCAKLGKEAEGLEFAPYPGDIGKRIYETISAEAWKMWLRHSTMVINEYRLNPSLPEAQKVLRTQMEEFLFGPGGELPPDYVPPEAQ